MSSPIPIPAPESSAVAEPRADKKEIQLLARLLVSLVHRLAPILSHRDDVVFLYRMVVHYWSKPESTVASELVKTRAHSLLTNNSRELIRFGLQKYDDGTLTRLGFDPAGKMAAPIAVIRAMGFA